MVSSLISSVSGTLEATGADWVDVAVGGVTLRVMVADTAVNSIGAVGEPVRLYTSLQVREDSLTLFGFLTDDERQTFESLLNVSGIGPRLSLAMLGRFSPQALAQAVAMIAAAAYGIPVATYAPREVKKAVTDYGGSSKEQVQQMVQAMLNLDDPLDPPDKADALAVAICHIQSSRVSEIEMWE